MYTHRPYVYSLINVHICFASIKIKKLNLLVPQEAPAAPNFTYYPFSLLPKTHPPETIILTSTPNVSFTCL